MSSSNPLKVLPLSPQWEEKYQTMVEQCSSAPIYYSLPYLKFLEAVCPEATPHHLIAVDEDRVVGALPLLSLKSRLGTVLNSLPFYGSHGGVLVNPKVGPTPVVSALSDALNALIASHEVVACTVVENPFGSTPLVPDLPGIQFTDSRISQVCPLPPAGHSLEDDLMKQIHSKTRNLIRKAAKSGLSWEISDSDESWKFLAETHRDNMARVGGQHKPEPVFKALRASFREGTERKLFIGKLDGEPIAALLLLYFNGIVEYFTPCSDDAHRSLNPLNLLIYQAMLDASVNGYRAWNWGGTWPSQEGVHHFKKRWGSTEKTYRYHTSVFNSELIEQSPDTLLNTYPNFFVVPFKELTS